MILSYLKKRPLDQYYLPSSNIASWPRNGIPPTSVRLPAQLDMIEANSVVNSVSRNPTQYQSSHENTRSEISGHVPSSSHQSTHAWVQVLVTHIAMINSFGLIQSFGISQLPYGSLLGSSQSTVAWVGSIDIFLTYVLAIFSGYTVDRGFYRLSVTVGSGFQIIALFAAGFSKTWWMTFLFHGVFQGIGHGLVFCSSITMTGIYFKDSKMKVTALSLAGCGASIGGILFPLIAKYTMNDLGISSTLRIIGGVVLFNSVLIQVLLSCLPVYKPLDICTEENTGKVPIFDWRIFKEKGYSLYVIATLFVFAALWTPYFYVRSFSSEVLHMTKTRSFIVLIIMNAAGIPGRIIPALVADYAIGTINAFIAILLFTSITLFCWPLVTCTAQMIPWAIAYGWCAGGVAFFVQAGIISLNDKPHQTAIKTGMASSIVGFASLLGAPVGGELMRIGKSKQDEVADSYILMMNFTGAFMLLGCMILCIIRLMKTGFKLKVKV